MNNLVKHEQYDIDGFDDIDDNRSASAMQGTRVKFTNEATWKTTDDDELPADLELLVASIARMIIKWGPDKKPVETHVIEPGRPWPDLVVMNASELRSEWRENFGKMEGPW